MPTNLGKYARGMDCQIRAPICNENPETTVLAHLPGGGMGGKMPDILAAHACSNCHAFVDGDYTSTLYGADVAALWHHEGVVRTIELLIRNGIIGVIK